MSTELVSDNVFRWALTFLTGGFAGAWLVVDAVSLIRSRHADRSDPVVRDKHFGYVIGIAIGAIGVIGCLRFWNVL
jgi:hypothetical protein